MILSPARRAGRNRSATRRLVDPLRRMIAGAALILAAAVIVVVVLSSSTSPSNATSGNASTGAGAATVRRRDLVQTDTEPGTRQLCQSADHL